MKKIFTLLFSMTLFGNLSAQQLSQLTTTGDFLKSYNPAQISENYFLFENTSSFEMVYRTQWLGLEGAPVTQVLSYQNLFETKNAFSLLFGGRLVNDQTGPTGMLGGYLNVAAMFTEEPYYGAWSIGLSFGAAQYRVNTADFKPRHAGDILLLNTKRATYPDVGFGGSWYKKMNGGFLDDGYVWGGVSVPQLVTSNATFENGGAGEFSFNKLPHVVVFGGFQKYFSKTAMVQPTVLVRYVKAAPTNIDFNVKYVMPNTFWVGIGASSSRALLTEVGMVLGENIGIDQEVRIGYHFGYSLKDYGASIGNIHEFQASYSFE